MPKGRRAGVLPKDSIIIYHAEDQGGTPSFCYHGMHMAYITDILDQEDPSRASTISKKSATGIEPFVCPGVS